MKDLCLISNLPKGAVITIPSLYVHGHDNKYYSDGTPRIKGELGEGYWLFKYDRNGKLTNAQEFITIKQLLSNSTVIEVE